MLSAKIVAHLIDRKAPGLWPVATYSDTDLVGLEYLATPIAQAALDASRAGTFSPALADLLRPRGVARPVLEMSVECR